jgi:hypothetical protein
MHTYTYYDQEQGPSLEIIDQKQIIISIIYSAALSICLFSRFIEAVSREKFLVAMATVVYDINHFFYLICIAYTFINSLTPVWRKSIFFTFHVYIDQSSMLADMAS